MPAIAQAPQNTFAAGVAILAKALSGFPEMGEAASVVSAIGGGEQAEQKNGKAYNGAVDFMGVSAQIKDGVGEIEGRGVYVSPDGNVVADDKGKIIGRVQNGKFVVLDQAHADLLMKNKMAEKGGAA